MSEKLFEITRSVRQLLFVYVVVSIYKSLETDRGHSGDISVVDCSVDIALLTAVL